MADDAIAAFHTVASQPDIDPDRIGLGGPSQGGWVAPIVARRLGNDVDFMCVVSAAVMTPAEQNIYSARTRLVSHGLDQEQVDAACEALRRLYEFYRTNEGREDVVRLLESDESASFRDHPVFERLTFTPDGQVPESVDPADYASKRDGLMDSRTGKSVTHAGGGQRGYQNSSSLPMP